MNCPGRFIDSVLEVGGAKVRGTAVSMGNPHFVIFQDFTEAEQERLAPLSSRTSRSPRGRTSNSLNRTMDIGGEGPGRGAGWTMACGTGACATAVAAALQGLVPYDREVEVRLPGGSLWISVAPGLSSVSMRGPAARVFRGEME